LEVMTVINLCVESISLNIFGRLEFSKYMMNYE
jgi:hypothetical protein